MLRPMSRHLAELLVSTLLALVALSPSLTRRLPLWGRVLVRLAAFAFLTAAVTITLGSPLSPAFGPPHSDIRAWAQAVEAAWIASLAVLAVSAVRLVVRLEDKPRETRIVSDLIAGAIFICAALAVTNVVFQLPVRGLLATSGVVAIVLGLALQSTLADVFSGIAVGLERPYKTGDLLWVEGAIEGVVLEVNWRSTQLATGDHNVAIIPNSVIAKARLINRSAPTPLRTDSVAVRLDAAVPPETCLAPLLAAAMTCRTLGPAPAPTVVCTGLAGDGNSYEVGFVVPSTAMLQAARAELYRELHRHLRFGGIALAVPNIASPPGRGTFGALDLVQNSDLFGGCPDEDRGVLVSHLVPVVRRPGETLLTEGQMSDGLFIIAAGAVEITRRDRVVHRMGPGETIGAVGFISQKPSLATATALTEVRALRLGEANLRLALADHPGLGRALEAMAARAGAILRLDVDTDDAGDVAHPEVFTAQAAAFAEQVGGLRPGLCPGPAKGQSSLGTLIVWVVPWRA